MRKDVSTVCFSEFGENSEEQVDQHIKQEKQERGTPLETIGHQIETADGKTLTMGCLAFEDK